MAKVSKTLDMMLGSHLDAHVMGKFIDTIILPLPIKFTLYLGGYEFLMQNCWSFFFPFSQAA